MCPQLILLTTEKSIVVNVGTEDAPQRRQVPSNGSCGALLNQLQNLSEPQLSRLDAHDFLKPRRKAIWCLDTFSPA